MLTAISANAVPQAAAHAPSPAPAPAASPASSRATAQDTVTISPAGQQAAHAGDVDHDGDSH
ncbi:MAG: hypothetical protein KGM96_13380 [Acidobacteriota bacterium]|nr:hypothetical protein [Acidobacteriota bacterium]